MRNLVKLFSFLLLFGSSTLQAQNFNQEELTLARDKYGIYDARPGITGLAQVNEIDMSTPELLAETDARMLKELTVSAYFKYIFMTVGGKGSGDVVKAK